MRCSSALSRAHIVSGTAARSTSTRSATLGQGIGLSVRHLMEETEEQIPFGSLTRGDQDSDGTGGP